MFVVASTCVVVLVSLILNTAQAFFTAPAPGFVHGLSIYDVAHSKRSGSSVESNEVTIRDIANDENENDEDDEGADEPEVQIAERTIVAVEFESELPDRDDKRGTKIGKEVTDDSDNQSPLDPWSIVWYIGSFGGLVAFFLIVSCSEWCCRRGARQLNSSYVNRGGNMTNDQTNVVNVSTETPPPPYHLFAPPPYDSVNYGDLVDKTSGEKIDIFVISVPVQSTAHQPAPA